MEWIRYPLAASKMLRHCEIFLATMQDMGNEEVVELAFNDFVTTSDRTLQYLYKELNKVGGGAPAWFRKNRDALPNRALMYDLRHIIAHHFFIPLTPIIYVEGPMPGHATQVSEHRLDLEQIPKDKKFDKSKRKYIEQLGPSVDAIEFCEQFYKSLSSMVKEAEEKYGNEEFYKRAKNRARIRINEGWKLSQTERDF